MDELPIFVPQGHIVVIGDITGVWRGGPYIDLYWSESWERRADDATAFININVYDYELGKPTISTEPEVRARVEEWIKENRDDLGGYLEQSI